MSKHGEADHTPGPWRAAIEPNDSPIWETEDECEVACLPHHIHSAVDVFGPRGMVEGCSLERLHANARLISAAPDMLEALRDLCNRVDEDPNYVPESEAYLRARAAIARATGNSR